MSIKIDLSSDVCPSCGFKKEVPNVPVCFFCHFRGEIGTVKMYVLMIMKEMGIRLTIDEIVVALNENEINDGRKEFKYGAVHRTLNVLASRDKMYSILSKSKIQNGKAGRPIVKFKYHLQRADKYLDRYLANWDSGRPVGIDYKEKPGKWERKNSLMIRNKSRVIRQKIRSGEYERFDFLFPNSLVKEKFQVRKVDEYVRPDVCCHFPHPLLTEHCLTEDHGEYVVEPK